MSEGGGGERLGLTELTRLKEMNTCGSGERKKGRSKCWLGGVDRESGEWQEQQFSK